MKNILVTINTVYSHIIEGEKTLNMNVNAQQYNMYESYDKSGIINILVLPDIIKSTILYLGATFKSVSPVGCPSYLSSPQPPSWDPPSKCHINVKQRKEAEQQEWPKCDKIDSYKQFSSDVNVHLQWSFPSVFVHQSENNVLLYKLNHSDDTSRSVSVSLTIRIYKNMILSVWINNTKLLQSILDRILSHTISSLQLWSQLHNIVSRYSIDTPDVDVTSSSKSLAHNVE